MQKHKDLISNLTLALVKSIDCNPGRMVEFLTGPERDPESTESLKVQSKVTLFVYGTLLRFILHLRDSFDNGQFQTAEVAERLLTSLALTNEPVAKILITTAQIKDEGGSVLHYDTIYRVVNVDGFGPTISDITINDKRIIDIIVDNELEEVFTMCAQVYNETFPLLGYRIPGLDYMLDDNDLKGFKALHPEVTLDATTEAILGSEPLENSTPEPAVDPFAGFEIVGNC